MSESASTNKDVVPFLFQSGLFSVDDGGSTTFVGDRSEGAARLAGGLARALSNAPNRPVLTRADLPEG